jgi:hypothetical protein
VRGTEKSDRGGRRRGRERERERERERKKERKKERGGGGRVCERESAKYYACAYPSSIEISALATISIRAITKLLLSATVAGFSGLILVTVKLIDTGSSFPMMVVRGLSCTLSRLVPGPEKGFPMEQVCLVMSIGWF